MKCDSCGKPVKTKFEHFDTIDQIYLCQISMTAPDKDVPPVCPPHEFKFRGAHNSEGFTYRTCHCGLEEGLEDKPSLPPVEKKGPYSRDGFILRYNGERFRKIAEISRAVEEADRWVADANEHYAQGLAAKEAQVEALAGELMLIKETYEHHPDAGTDRMPYFAHQLYGFAREALSRYSKEAKSE